MAIAQFQPTTQQNNGQVGIRSYLNSQGFNNNQITYDPTNQNVNLNGQYFTHATPQANGLTYGNVNDLRNAMNQYNQGNMQQNMYNTLNTINQRTAQAPPVFSNPQPFNYNVQSDPQYQQALQNEQNLIGQTQGNTLVDMARRGISNSSISANDMNRVGQQMGTNFNAQVMPQMIEQAYQRYQDQNNNDYRNQMANYQVGQDQLGNLRSALGLENNLNQQNFQNQNTMAGLTGTLSDGTPTYQAQQQQLANALNAANAFGTVSPEQAKLIGIPAGTPTRELQALQNQMRYQDAELGLRGQTNQIAQDRLLNEINSTGARNQYYQARTAEANANLNKTPNKSAASYKNDPNFAQDFSYLQNNPTEAANLLKTNSAKFIQEYGMDGYNALRSELTAIQKAQSQP